MPGDDRDLSFTAVGDLMLGDSAKCVGFGVRSATSRSGFGYLFQKICNFLEGDIVFANLECVVGDHDFCRWSFRKAQMRGAPGAVTALREAGITVLNVANNHAMQHGEVGFRATCRAIEEAGLHVVGLRGTGRYLCHPLVLDLRGKKVGILGYGCTTENYCRNTPLYAQGHPPQIIADTAMLSEECDKVVVSLHWGDEFVSGPSAEIVDLGRKVIDAGACLVVGHHPHVLQEAEAYRDGIILYSLGNFVSDMLWDDPLRKGIIVTCDVGATTQIRKTVLVETCDDYSVAPLAVAEHYPVSHCSRVPAEYESYVERLRLRNRNLSHLHVAKNFHRYNPAILAQIAFQSLRSALHLQDASPGRRSVRHYPHP
ncbi:CapA family protein [Geomonas sp. RF6]|uniref:CapA family protein n=1 Tax=Geomonas sp. RF6 TaxID=2897342 RepID=UPI001E4CD93C|nr:CapA family protein [Geomonas sp. RF6]UFS69140.1 CapA family protein [Geomonas sp. RF6]